MDNATAVRTAVQTTLDPDTPSSRRAEAEAWLGALGPAFVMEATRLIGPTESTAVRFWAAGWLLGRARAGVALDRGLLLEGALRAANDGVREVMARLCACLALVALHAPVGSWPDVVPSLIAYIPVQSTVVAGNAEIQGGSAEGAEVLLTVFHCLPDELYRDIDKRVLGTPVGDREQRMLHELHDARGLVVDVVGKTMMVSETLFVQGARVLSTWLERNLIGISDMGHLVEWPLAQGLVAEADVVFTAAVEAFATLVTIPADTPRALDDMMQCVACIPGTPPGFGRAPALFDLPCQFIEKHLTILLQGSSIEALLYNMVGWWVRFGGADDVDLSEIGVRMWHAVVLGIVESADRPRLQGVLTRLVQDARLLAVLRDKLMHTPVDHDDKVAFDAVASSIGDCAGMICFVCKVDAVSALRRELVADVEALASVRQGDGSDNAAVGVAVAAAVGIEARARATLALLSSAAALLPMCDVDGEVGAVFEVLETLQPLPPSALIFVGNMASWLALRPEYLTPAAELVARTLVSPHVDPKLRAAAAEALAELCTYTPEQMQPILPMLCHGECDLARLLVEAGHSAPAVLRSIALLLQRLDKADAQQYMEAVVLPYVGQLQRMVGVSGGAVEHDAQLLGLLVGTAALIEALGDTSAEFAFTTFETAWPGLAACLQHRSGDEELVAAASKCVGAAFDSSPEACRAVMGEVLDAVLQCWERGHEPSLLDNVRRHALSMVCKEGGEITMASRVAVGARAMVAADASMAHTSCMAAALELQAEVYDVAGRVCDATTVQAGLDMAAHSMRSVSRTVVKAAAKLICRMVRAASQGDVWAGEALRDGLSPLLRNVLVGLAWDVPRECFGDVAKVFESLATACPDQFCAVLEALLRDMEGVPMVAREAVAAALLSPPYNYPRTLDAVAIFAESGRVPASS
eukprot:m.115750 g.115750  ORF g.115750 m.115750 type:complete len:924 (-) comp10893_c1_seq1:106-2877(-)